MLRSGTELKAGASAVGLEYVSSITLSGLGHDQDWEEQLGLWQAANPWPGEFRWRATLAERGLYNVGVVDYDQVGSKSRIALTSTGAWSTAEHLPMGLLEDLATGNMLACWNLVRHFPQFLGHPFCNARLRCAPPARVSARDDML